MKEKGIWVFRVLNTIAFILMIAVNILANTLPLNGITTGKVSYLYDNLFTPTALTFAIWGVIYFLLALFILYQWGLFKGKSGYSLNVVKHISLCFIISSLANIAWIFSWHYKMIPLSIVLMIVLLFSLICAYKKISGSELSLKEKIFVKLPFSIYLAWITIATIANFSVLLVSLGWNDLGISEEIWTVLILAAGMTIGVVNTVRGKDPVYGLVILWAYIGILIRHVSPSGFDAKYAGIIIYLAISIIVIFISVIIAAVKSKKKLKP